MWWLSLIPLVLLLAYVALVAYFYCQDIRQHESAAGLRWSAPGSQAEHDAMIRWQQDHAELLTPASVIKRRHL